MGNSLVWEMMKINLICKDDGGVEVVLDEEVLAALTEEEQEIINKSTSDIVEVLTNAVLRIAD